MIQVPFDMHAAARLSGWRERFVWPVSLLDSRDTLQDLVHRYLLGIEALAPRSKSLAWQTTRYLSDLVLSVEIALLMSEAENAGIELAGGPPIASVLRGERPGQSDFTAVSMLPSQPVRWGPLREMVRTWTWSTPGSFVRAVGRPQATAMSHNSLLAAEISRDREAVRFRHAFRGFDRAARDRSMEIRANQKEWEDAVEDVIELIRGTIRTTPHLDSGISGRVADFTAESARSVLAESALVLETARQMRRLPTKVRVGSPGQPKLRAIVQEVRRRGGTVTAYDHAAAAGLAQDSTGLITVEMAVSDRFVSSTRTVADMIGGNALLQRFRTFEECAVRPGRGDPAFLAYGEGLRNTTAMGGRPKVLYVVGAFDGARRRSPPSLCDPVKLVWWTETASVMQSFPIEFKMQVHPGGSLRGDDNPLHGLVPTTRVRFQQAVDWADVLVVDVTQSTTVTEALCLNKPLVLIDYGRNVLYPKVMEMISRRAKWIKASFDTRGVPTIDPEELKEAILGPALSMDGSEFREAYGGRAE